MTFRMRGIELPSWGSDVGSAVNRVWLEYYRREQRRERAQIEHDMMVAYALAGSPEGDVEKRFDVVESTKKVLFSHLDHSVHRTAYKQARLKLQMKQIQERMAEMERLDWISGDSFSIAEWIAGK